MQRSGGGLHRGGLNPQQGMGIIPTLFGIHQGETAVPYHTASSSNVCPDGLQISPKLIATVGCVQGKEGSQSPSQQSSNTRWGPDNN